LVVLTDEVALVAALRAGDETAFAALVARHYAAMRRVARGYVASDAAADEVVQDTWLAVVAGIDRFEARSTVSTWLFGILTNQAKRRGAREARVVPFSSFGPEGDEPAVDPDRFQRDDEAWPGHWATPPRPFTKPERRLLALEARERLKRALDLLPERQQIVVTLRDVEGLTSQEVCDLLDISPENQRVLLHRGRSQLRAELEAYVEDAA
jgi:RNA polymerase sigma-70 factor, ECF subfamily